MPVVVLKKDGTAMVHYSKEELHDLIQQARLPEKKTEGQKIMERSR